MVEFGLAHRKCQYGQKVNALKKSLVSGFSDPTLAAEARFVQEYIHLLERQIPIDVSSAARPRRSSGRRRGRGESEEQRALREVPQEGAFGGSAAVHHPVLLLPVPLRTAGGECWS